MKRALELNPQEYQPWYDAGLSSYEMGHYEEAINHYKTALSFDSNKADVYNSLA